MLPPSQIERSDGCVVKLKAPLVTVKSVALAAVLPETVTVSGPVDAPLGTVVVILVAELAFAVASVPLKRTVLFAGVVLKFVPVIVTMVVTGPLPGVKLVIVGSDEAMVKSPELATVLHPIVIEMGPVVAPVGTLVVMVVAVLAVTTAVVPLNSTMLLAGVVLKFVPVIVTVVPVVPLEGKKLVIVCEAADDVLSFWMNAAWPLRLNTQLPGSKSVLPLALIAR